MSETARRDVFQAIADPTRRKIIDLVAQQPMNLRMMIAINLQISQPAISQQVKILQECGIVELETMGRERLCSIDPRNLIPAFLWLEQYEALWTNRIDSFEKYVNKLHAKNKKQKK